MSRLASSMCENANTMTINELLNFFMSSNPSNEIINDLHNIINEGNSGSNKTATVMNFLNQIPSEMNNQTVMEFLDNLNETEVKEINQLLGASTNNNTQLGGKKSRKTNRRRNLTRRRQYGGVSRATKFKAALFAVAMFLMAMFPYSDAASVSQIAVIVLAAYEGIRFKLWFRKAYPRLAFWTGH